MKDLKVLFEERRSVNFFDRSKPLDNTLLKKIISLAVVAPTAFNLQPYRVIVAQSKSAKDKLYQTAGQPKILEAPVTLILVGDRNGYSADNTVWRQMEEMGMDQEAISGAQSMAQGLYGSSEERKIKFAESNSGLFAMSLMYAAKYYGVDSHPMSGLDFAQAHKLFGLGENEDIVMLVALGYFDTNKTLYPRRARRTFDELVTLL